MQGDKCSRKTYHFLYPTRPPPVYQNLHLSMSFAMVPCMAMDVTHLWRSQMCDPQKYYQLSDVNISLDAAYYRTSEDAKNVYICAKIRKGSLHFNASQQLVWFPHCKNAYSIPFTDPSFKLHPFAILSTLIYFWISCKWHCLPKYCQTG